MIILRNKNFATTVDGGGVPMSYFKQQYDGLSKKQKRKQTFTQFYQNKLSALNNDINTANKARQDQRNQMINNIAKTGTNPYKDVAMRARQGGYNAGFNQGAVLGQQSVSGLGGLGQWASNTWNSGWAGKVGLAAAATVPLALALSNYKRRCRRRRDDD